MFSLPLPHIRFRFPRRSRLPFALAAFIPIGMLFLTGFQTPPAHQLLSGSFDRLVLAPVLPEAPFHLRFFTTAVKTDSKGRIITGPTADPVKNIVGAEDAGLRAGIRRFTKILFGAGYFGGTPGIADRVDPNNQIVPSGGQHWPHVPQPFRSWPNALALTADGSQLYVTLPGREGYPDWRVAVVNTASRQVQWIDLRPAGQTRGTRPTGLAVSPDNPAISVSPYVVVPEPVRKFRERHRHGDEHRHRRIPDRVLRGKGEIQPNRHPPVHDGPL